MSGEKTCTWCGFSKPLDRFHRNKATRDGLRSHCKECRAQERQVRAEELSAKKARYRAENHEKVRAQERASEARYRAKHPERIKAKYANNPHTWWESYYRQRAHSFGYEPVVESFTRDDLVTAWGAECYLCGGEWVEIDHVIEVHQGGHHTIENVRPCCRACNMRKSMAIRKKMNGGRRC